MRHAVATLLLLLSGSIQAGLQPDPQFGNAGVVDVGLGARPVSLAAPKLFVQPDRRITLAALIGDSSPQPPTLKLIRLLPDARPDPAFGTNGVVTAALSALPVSYGAVRQLMPLADGRAFVFSSTMRIETVPGTNDPIYHPQVQLQRVRGDGSPDPAFNGGLTWTNDDPRFSGSQVLLHGDSATLVSLGVACCDATSGLVALRLRADGSTDTAFGKGGLLTVAPDASNAAGIMPLVGGGFQVLHYLSASPSGPERNFWRRYRVDGSLDTAFGPGGEQEIPLAGSFAMTRLYAVGDGTQIGADGGCPQRWLDAEGRVRATFTGCPARVPFVNARVQPYGDNWLYSGEERFGGVPPPSDGTYLFVTDRFGRIDAGFAEPQGLRWRSPEAPTASYSVAADGGTHVVLARASDEGMRVLRYRDVRGAEPVAQSVPALAAWSALLLGLALVMFVHRRLRRG